MLSDAFLALAGKTAESETIALQCWEEIVKHYSEPSRHYHTLNHLQNLISELEGCRRLVSDWDTLLYTLYYHDIIYDASRQDNEERSAQLARNRMEQLYVIAGSQERCVQQIQATKAHVLSEDPDANLFTDADLSILGKPEAQYQEYCHQVRQEYIIYPDALYRPGRARVLQHFLDMPHIFKTDHFRNLYELQARYNLAQELELLHTAG